MLSRQVLKLDYQTPLSKTLIDMAYSMINSGKVPRPPLKGKM